MAPKRHSRRMVSFAGGPDASIEDMVGTGGGGGGGEVGSSPREEPRRAPRFPDRRRTYSTLIESTSDLEEKLNVANRTIEEMEAVVSFLFFLSFAGRSWPMEGEVGQR